MKNNEISDALGQEFGRGLRGTSKYEETRAQMEKEGLSHEILNKTPPVGVNLKLLSEMPGIHALAERINGHPINVAMLGLANIDGAEDTHRFISSALKTIFKTFHIVDIDPDIIASVSKLKQERSWGHVIPHLLDARHTQLPDASIDLVIRDHTGNCCPPAIDREIDKETSRILKPGGASIVNISTSELLQTSPNRIITPMTGHRINRLGPVTDALRSRIYDLAQFKREFGDRMEIHRGNLLEIEQPDGFVVFGEDGNGHGEWFRRLGDHIHHWNSLGFSISDMKSRFGADSHIPPLLCFRHNIVLTKREES